MEQFNLYDEKPKRGTYTGVSTDIDKDSPLRYAEDYKSNVEERMIEIDISEPETLFSMSKPIRDTLKDKPDDYELVVYLVCGNAPSKDAGLLVDYLKDVTQPIVIAFRGIIHFDFINLFLNNTIHLNSSSKLMYSKHKLHETMKNFLVKPDSFKRFMQRFIDGYWNLNDGNLLPISELELLGIKTIEL